MIQHKDSSTCDISIIIVNYNSGEYLYNSVLSIINSISIDYEIVIWDNNSMDDSIKIIEDKIDDFSRIKIFKCKDNLGFAKANNRACLEANGKIFHFLNPDTIVNNDLDFVYKELIQSNEEHVAITRLMDDLNNDIKITHVLPTLGNYFKKLLRIKGIGYWSIGANIIMSREVFYKIGKWSEDYFMYTEDMDMFYCIFKNKIPVKSYNCSIVHVGKVSSNNKWSEYQRLLQIEKSYKHFYSKYKIFWQYLLIRPLQLFYTLLINKRESFLSTKAFITLLIKNNK